MLQLKDGHFYKDNQGNTFSVTLVQGFSSEHPIVFTTLMGDCYEPDGSSLHNSKYDIVKEIL